MRGVRGLSPVHPAAHVRVLWYAFVTVYLSAIGTIGGLITAALLGRYTGDSQWIAFANAWWPLELYLSISAVVLGVAYRVVASED